MHIISGYVDTSLNLHRITEVLKFETDIITSITASLTGRAMLLVIMYVEIFKTGVDIFIHDVKRSELVLAHASYELPLYFCG